MSPQEHFISEKQAWEGNRKRCAAFHLIFYSLKFYELAKRSYTVKWCFSSKSAKIKKKNNAIGVLDSGCNPVLILCWWRINWYNLYGRQFGNIY